MEPIKTELVVLGAGPGGYAAAFYAAVRGKKTLLVDLDKRLGGVCLNRGCIPSKALLSATHLIRDAKESKTRGIEFMSPKVDLGKLRAWKESVVNKLSQGVTALARSKGVQVLQGRGHFEGSDTLRVETQEGQQLVTYQQAIIAVGSRPAMPPAFDLGNKRIMTSDEALEIKDIPKNLLVVGGGYIGMELGTVYAALGSAVTISEAMSSLLLGPDADLVRPVARFAEKHFKSVRLNARVLKMATHKKQIAVTLEVEGKKVAEKYDRVLVSVGRAPNCSDLGLRNTRVRTDGKGFIQVNSRQQTHDPKIYAVGDVTGGVLLAHKASKEARIAVENILGQESVFEDIIIPAVVFTDPEVAWCGLTETEARQKKISVKISRYSWAGSGRALSFDRPDGMTKLIIEPDTERILGVGLVGAGAGELIGEGAIAVEMGATAKDIAETVHPHPTLSETLMECAEVFYGTSTHMYSAKRN